MLFPCHQHFSEKVKALSVHPGNVLAWNSEEHLNIKLKRTLTENKDDHWTLDENVPCLYFGEKQASSDLLSLYLSIRSSPWWLPVSLQIIGWWCEVGSRMRGHEEALNIVIVRIWLGFLKRTPGILVVGVHHHHNRKQNKAKLMFFLSSTQGQGKGHWWTLL